MKLHEVIVRNRSWTPAKGFRLHVDITPKPMMDISQLYSGDDENIKSALAAKRPKNPDLHTAVEKLIEEIKKQYDCKVEKLKMPPAWAQPGAASIEIVYLIAHNPLSDITTFISTRLHPAFDIVVHSFENDPISKHGTGEYLGAEESSGRNNEAT